MITPDIHKLSYSKSIQFLQNTLESSGHPLSCNQKKHKVRAFNEQHELLFELRLPLPMPRLPEESAELKTYTNQLSAEIPAYVLVLIQAGASALGYFEEGEAIDHKAIKKYMKRRKQGKAQLSYLKKRGKSKAGSRVRLANTVSFFEDINERLNEWEEDYQPTRIIYSCTPTLWGLLFQSKIRPPFEKKDPRLVKVPTNVHIPSFEELLRINEFVLCGMLQEASV